MVAMKRTMKAAMKSAKKAKTEDIGPKIKELKEIISNSECDVAGPSGNKDMLIHALPYALGDYSDVRHEYQTTVANLIGQVLQGWVAKWEQKVTDAQASVDTTATDLTAAEATQDTAKSAVTAQKEDVKACKEALKAASGEEKEAKEALATANGAVADFDKKLQAVVAEKDSVSMVYNQSFLVMKAAEGVSGSEAKGHLKKVTHSLKKITKESSLLIAISPALEKAPAERGQFDSMAIDGVDAAFKAEIAKLGEEISKQDETKKELESKAAEAKSVHDAKDGKKQECSAALKASQEALDEKEKALAAAEKGVDTASKASSKALRVHKHEQHGCDSAKGNYATFQTLLARTTPPPEPEPVEEEEAPEAPAETAA